MFQHPKGAAMWPELVSLHKMCPCKNLYSVHTAMETSWCLAATTCVLTNEPPQLVQPAWP